MSRHQQIDHEKEESEEACGIEILIQRPNNQILQNMKPMVDSTSSIEEMQDIKLLKIPKEYKNAWNEWEG